MLYELSFKDTYGNVHKLEDYTGKVLLLVNTATKCGFAPQLEELERLYKDYKDQGLMVIGFPCNQFASQEPETNDTMVNVCQLNFGVTFLLSEKLNVNGKVAHPLYKFLKSHSRSMLGKEIKWNFTKFLISRDGTIIKRYAPTTRPDSLRQSIEKMISA